MYVPCPPAVPICRAVGEPPFSAGTGAAPRRLPLPRAENAVTGVTEAGDDIAVLVEMGIDGGRIDVHVRVRFFNALDAFGGAYEVEAEDALAAALLRRSIVAMSDPPVASMGSRMMAMRWSISLASFT